MRHATEYYDASDLPKEIGNAVGSSGSFKVEVVQESDEPRFWRLRGIAARRKTSVADAVERVRALRDEWD